jgi:hypothetical protein
LEPFTPGLQVSTLPGQLHLYLPALLIAILVIRAARERRLLAQLRSATLSFALTYGLVVLYMLAFWTTYGTFGVSKVSNVNLLGTVMTLQYHYQMPLDSLDPQYAKLQTDIRFFRGGKPDPWGFVAAHPEYDAHAGAFYGAFAMQLLRAHPDYVARGAYDTFLTTTSWNQLPAMLAPLNQVPGWLLEGSRVISLVYSCLPLLLLATVPAAWRDPRSFQAVILAALMLLVLTQVCIAVLADFESYNRLRMPVDWAMLLVTGLAGVEVVGWRKNRSLELALNCPTSEPEASSGHLEQI